MSGISLDQVVAQIESLVRSLMGDDVTIKTTYGQEGVEVFISNGAAGGVTAPVRRSTSHARTLSPVEFEAECTRVLGLCDSLASGQQRPVVIDLRPWIVQRQVQQIIVRVRRAGFWVKVWLSPPPFLGGYSSYRFTEAGSARIFVEPLKEKWSAMGDQQADIPHPDPRVPAVVPSIATGAGITIGNEEVTGRAHAPEQAEPESAASSAVSTASPVLGTTSLGVLDLGLGSERRNRGRGLSDAERSDQLLAGLNVRLSRRERDKLSSPDRIKKRFKLKKPKGPR